MQKRFGSVFVVCCLMVCLLFINNQNVNAAGKVRLNKTSVTLTVGEKCRLSLKNMPKGGRVTWSTSAKGKAAVSKKGVVTAKKQGKATIKAKLTYQSNNRKRTQQFSCKVTVRKKSASAGKSLVVYFSAPVQKRANQVDGISSASRTTTGKNYKGNTEYIAELIRAETGADVVEIVPKKAYPDVYEEMVTLAEEEQESNARPEIKNRIKNMGQYENIYIGYPIWWSDMPQILYTFFDSYDLGGKNIFPFCTHGGSGLAGTVAKIRNLEPEATVYQGLSLYRTEVTGSEGQVKAWIQKRAR